jgi:hypothetical protein
MAAHLEARFGSSDLPPLVTPDTAGLLLDLINDGRSPAVIQDRLNFDAATAPKDLPPAWFCSLVCWLRCCEAIARVKSFAIDDDGAQRVVASRRCPHCLDIWAKRRLAGEKPVRV